MTHANRLLSVDPGDPSGWALWTERDHRWSLDAFGELPEPRAPEVFALLGRLATDWSGASLVVEDQFYAAPSTRVADIRSARGRGPAGLRWRSPSSGRVLEVVLEADRRTAPVDAVLKLRDSADWWVAAAELAGLAIEDRAPPGRWIPAATRGWPERDSRKRVQAVASAKWGGYIERLAPDEAAAVLLGEWFIAELGDFVERRGAPRRGLRGLPEGA